MATVATAATVLSASGCTGAPAAPRGAATPPAALRTTTTTTPATPAAGSAAPLSTTPVASMQSSVETASPPVTVSTVTGVSRLTVTLAHRAVAAGVRDSVTVTVVSSSGFVNGFRVAYGDGTGYDEPPVAAMCPAQPSSSSPAPASSRTWHLHHAYRRAGTFRVTVVTQTMGECSRTAPDEHLEAVARVDIG